MPVCVTVSVCLCVLSWIRLACVTGVCMSVCSQLTVNLYICLCPQLEGLRIGSLHIATMDGLTVGRDPSQQVGAGDNARAYSVFHCPEV